MAQARAKAPEVAFTPEEQGKIRSAASRVWGEIAHDVMEAARGTTVSRDEVVEAVCDADRLTRQVVSDGRRAGKLAEARELARRIDAAGTEIYPIVRQAFPHNAYV